AIVIVPFRARWLHRTRRENRELVHTNAVEMPEAPGRSAAGGQVATRQENRLALTLFDHKYVLDVCPRSRAPKSVAIHPGLIEAIVEKRVDIVDPVGGADVPHELIPLDAALLPALYGRLVDGAASILSAALHHLRPAPVAIFSPRAQCLTQLLTVGQLH